MNENCLISEEILAEYPYTMQAIFASTTENSTQLTAGHIPNNSAGFFNEIEQIGDAYATPGSNVPADPTVSAYSSRLRPMSDIAELDKKNGVYLSTLEYLVYDTTIEGSLLQDAATLAEIHASKATNDAYAQSVIRNGLLPDFQPNYFRPSFKIDGKEYISGISAAHFAGHKGDLSIGLHFPCCLDVNKEIPNVRNISAFGFVAQKVKGMYQRYFVVCTANFRYK